MHNVQPTITLIIVTILLSAAATAQVDGQKLEIGAGLSTFIYQGDLTPSKLGSFRTLRFGINLSGTKMLSAAFSLRTNLAFGGLRGNDAAYDDPAYRKERAFNFRSRVIELSELLVWNPLGTNYADKGFYPYFFAGVGLSSLKIKRDWSNYNPEYFDADVSARLAIDQDHALPKIIPVVPLGLGVRYNVSSRIGVNAETSYRLLSTDYLDGFSEAANPSKNDHYQTISVGAVYRIGKKNRFNCPIVKY